jgi:hypothetical protein
LTAFLTGRTTWPTYREFIAGGGKGLREAVARIGGVEYWAREMGMTESVRPRGGVVRWTDDAIEAALTEFLAGREAWPTRTEFADAGLRGLAEVLRDRGDAPKWAKRMGVAPPRRLPRRLSRTAHVPPREQSSPDKPWPRWTEQTVTAALTEFLAGRDTWPKHSEFVETGRKGLYHAVLKHGGSQLWARRMGVQWIDRKRCGRGATWTEERVRAELSSYLVGRTAWPTAHEFASSGHLGLLNAARRSGGTEKWIREFSLQRAHRQPARTRERRARRQPSERRLSAEPRWSDERIETAIAPLIKKLGRWPTKAEFRRAGQSRALSAVYDHGGSARWQQHFGVEPRRLSGLVPDRTRWTEERIERELIVLRAQLRRWPTGTELREHVPSGLYSAVVRHGGVRKWRKRLTSVSPDPVAR